MIMRQAWPFLFSKSVRQDYFTVLCPKYIIDGGLQKQFRAELNQLARNDTDSHQTRIFEQSALGKMTIFYKCERAQEGGVDLKDAQDRPFVRVYGVVIGGLHRDIIEPFKTSAAYGRALEQIEKAFGDLCANPSGFDTRPSSPITMPSDGPIVATGVRPDSTFLARKSVVAVLVGFLMGAGLVYLTLARQAQINQANLEATRWELLRTIKGLESQNAELSEQLKKATGVGPTPAVAAPPEAASPP
jgi:hypothetical protein